MCRQRNYRGTSSGLRVIVLAAILILALGCGNRPDPEYVHGFGTSDTDGHGHRLDDLKRGGVPSTPAPVPHSPTR